MLVSVIILTYNSEKFIEDCLKSLEDDGYAEKEIIVVDNTSKDKTREIVEKYIPKSKLNIIYVQNETNRGCCGGNNDGFLASKGEIVIFLNPDTIVTKGWISELIRPMVENESVGVTGCKILYPDRKTIQHCGGIIHPNGFTDHIGNKEEDKGQYDKIREVDYVTGAAIAIRRNVFEELDGLDMDYFPAYFEETDFCVRAREKDYKILYVPKAVIIHYESTSLAVFSPRFHTAYAKARVKFLLKNYSMMHIFTKAIPYEFKWFLKGWSKGLRRYQIKAYVHALIFFTKKLFKRKRRNLI